MMGAFLIQAEPLYLLPDYFYCLLVYRDFLVEVLADFEGFARQLNPYENTLELAYAVVDHAKEYFEQFV